MNTTHIRVNWRVYMGLSKQWRYWKIGNIKKGEIKVDCDELSALR